MTPAPPGTWSLAMIVRDEEENLPRVLDDVGQLCDEIVIVDTGSTDGTKEVATSYGARVVDFTWIDDFAAARNRSFEECSSEWVLWLDADDRVPPRSLERLAGLRAGGVPDVDVVVLPYYYVMSENDPELCQLSLERERLVRRGAGLRWEHPVHEVIYYPSDRAARLDAPIVHRPPRGVKEAKGERNLAILWRAYHSGDRSEHVLFHLAKDLQAAGHDEDVLKIVPEYLEVAMPAVSRAFALRIMARSARELGNDSLARECLVNALYTDPRQAETWMALGLERHGRAEWAEAVPFFAAAAALRPASDMIVEEPAYSWWPLDLLSSCHTNLGDYEKALEEVSRALETSDDDDRLLDNIELIIGELTKGKGSAVGF